MVQRQAFGGDIIKIRSSVSPMQAAPFMAEGAFGGSKSAVGWA